MLFNVCTAGADEVQVSWKVPNLKMTMCRVLFLRQRYPYKSAFSLRWVLYICFLNRQVPHCLWTKSSCSLIKRRRKQKKYEQVCSYLKKQKQTYTESLYCWRFIFKYDWNKMTCSKCSYLVYMGGICLFVLLSVNQFIDRTGSPPCSLQELESPQVTLKVH